MLLQESTINLLSQYNILLMAILPLFKPFQAYLLSSSESKESIPRLNRENKENTSSRNWGNNESILKFNRDNKENILKSC